MCQISPFRIKLYRILACLALTNTVFSQDCTYEWIEDNGRTHCYYDVQASMEMHEAQQYCFDQYGGGVVTITTKEEQDIVEQIMNDAGLISIWLGLQETQTTWQWLDGEEILEQGCFQDQQDDANVRFRNQFEVRNEIRTNSYGSCVDECKEQQYTYAATKNGIYCWCGTDFVIGDSLHASDRCNTPCPANLTQSCGGQFSKQVLSVRGGYSDWLSGQPNNHQTYQPCATLDPTVDPPMQWIDTNCGVRKSALCHIKNLTVCEQMKLDTASNDWEYVQIVNLTDVESCYYISWNAFTWFEANEFCVNLDGDLVNIKDRHITDALVSIKDDIGIAELKDTDTFQAELWIGLQRSRWYWNSGEELVYTDWEDTKPASEAALCVLFTALGWDDEDCTGQFSTICEKDSAVNYHTTTTTHSTTTPPTSTTTHKATTTTVLTPRPQPVRKRPRVHSSEKGISDHHQASIVAGGVVMLVIIIVVCSVSCIVYSKKKKKRKEEEAEAKKEKYFFGFDGGLDDFTQERKRKEAAKSSEHIETQPKEGATTQSGPSVAPLDNDESSKYETVAEISMDEKRLSDKPDVIPH